MSQEELADQVEETTKAESEEVKQEVEADLTENPLQIQVKELEGKLLRTMADFDNFRKRSRVERDDLLKYASSKLVENLLPVLDNFGLALQSETGDAESLKKGIEMVYRQLQTVLEGEGLQVMNAVGTAFDPNQHEAVMQVEAEGAEPGQVVEEMRKGYLLKDKVIRPAMVKVSI